jgi:phosphatidate cytidylyltransferase
LKNLLTRTLTGTIFILIIGGTILFHPVAFFILFAIITFLGLLEFYKLIGNSLVHVNTILGLITGMVFFAISCLYGFGFINAVWFLLAIPCIVLIMIIELYRKKDNPFHNIAYTILGILYIAVPFSLLVLSGFPERSFAGYKPTLLLGFFFLLWSCDTGAYVVGMTLGKHSLFPRISPKKSWEGSIGGFIFTTSIAFIIAHYYKSLPLTDWLIMAGIICIFGTWGDLVESLLKRSLQVKDSGDIFPGHGGILDRFDSVLLSAPFVFLYLHLKFFVILS